MNFEERYGTLDRLLYRMAFRLSTAQHALGDVENLLYGDVLEDVSIDDPVFLTALPRSGTTILLRLLCDSGHFASHTYQDMPFVLCPMLWRRFCESFSTDSVSRDRAHGDGLEVSETSPEAFEEMIWKHFWPSHYEDDRILPWTPDEHHAPFDRFLRAHMRKVIALRNGDNRNSLRYVSKNNLNIARMGAPPPPLQEGTFLIPFREPLQQAASLRRQHRRFLDLHETDDFVREYMEAIGHHEFGKGLRPVDFGGWLADAPPPNDLSFWVQYWTAAYQYVLSHAGSDVVLLSYDRLTTDPTSTLGRLADALDVPRPDLVQQSDRLDPPRTHSVDPAALSASVREEATEVHDRLKQQATC